MSKLLQNTGGSPILGCTLNFGANFSAQIVSRVGYDFVLIDMEHNPLSAREASSLTQSVIFASGGRCSPFVRVPSHGVEWIKWALDSGAHALVVPMVQSAAEMKLIIERAIYPPDGQRSFGPMLAPYASLDPTDSAAKYFARRQDIALVPMIESSAVVAEAELETICSLKHVSALFVGPVDLRLSLGLPGGEGNEENYVQLLDRIVSVCKRHQKPVGIFAADGPACNTRITQGFDFIVLPGEAAMLAAGARFQLEACKTAIARGRNSPRNYDTL